jgi:FKBP-type peptidyl-prolyl cis-trans isomerase
VQAEENEAKRQLAAQRLKTAYDTNIALLENKRQEFYKRERENVERRKAQAEEREATDAAKREKAAQKAEQRKVQLSSYAYAQSCTRACPPGCLFRVQGCGTGCWFLLYHQSAQYD